ncbi:MAG: PEP-utilizing enzyme [Candidatus Woesearchaeota archaeon]
MDILNKVKELKWKLLVNRKETPLCKSFIDNGYVYFFETGIPSKITACLRLYNGESYFLAKELDAITHYFSEDSIVRVSNFKENMLLYLEDLERISYNIEKTDFTNKSKQELIKIFEDFSHAVHLATNFLVPTVNAGDVLKKKLIDLLPEASEQQKQEWVNTLIYPSEENSYVEEEKSFMNLVEMIKLEDGYHSDNFKSDDFNGLLEEHLRIFAWIGARGWWLKYAWTKEDIIARIKLALESNSSHDVDKILEERKFESEKLARQLNLEGNEILELSKDFAYLRTWRTDIIYGAGYRARNIFYRIAELFGFEKEDIVYLMDEEILEMLNDDKIVSKKEITGRKESFTMLTLENKQEIFSGKEIDQKFASLFFKEVSLNEVKGNSAFPGKVQGKVKLVLTAADLGTVEKGDILVAVMTFPHFIAAMEKAAAFVTDEGGILCHAAIISREMKKPCVIATKEATKVFKDGDLVEVDADKGVVRKIEQVMKND